MFRRKPQYSQEDINQQVANLEKLNKLRDMCMQKMILQPKIEAWRKEGERYERNIETGQRYLDYMQNKVNSGKV